MGLSRDEYKKIRRANNALHEEMLLAPRKFGGWSCKEIGNLSAVCELEEKNIVVTLCSDSILVETPKKKITYEHDWTGVKSEVHFSV